MVHAPSGYCTQNLRMRLGALSASHGGLDRRVFAVALYEHLGGAVDVEVGDHGLDLIAVNV